MLRFIQRLSQDILPAGASCAIDQTMMLLPNKADCLLTVHVLLPM